ncbi:hypothetical protein B9Z55_018019 [Caenorhabditis nigoni]|uniref:glucuronosyltransferase n=1 Tax=Caenorhabditis nigoni TaxID=1611254 RepID=A0A2G5TCR4_9PELO|nr:hypothetical protein B9Z55_018019 [Caenorhabditis nigoni]
MDQLRSEKFDLAIAESLFVHAFALFEELGIRSVINTDSNLYSSGMKYALGEPSAASYYPTLYATDNPRGFIGRFSNFIGYFLGNTFDSWKFDAEIAALPETYKGPRCWKTLFSNVAFNFVNSNPFIDYPTATLPKTVFVGGMQVITKKQGKMKLSKEWDEVLSKRSSNVLVSFGSMAYSSLMPDEYKKAFLEVFASMPETTFIWKYEEVNATLADHLPNVKLTNWMPQNDLLADDRLNLFVTHGGLGSTIELAYQGKPAVVVPLLGDQPRNAHMLTRHGGALQLDKSLLDQPDEIRKSIQTVLGDSNYKKNAEKLAKILDEQPNKPKDIVLKHCDFAVQFGPMETLNSEGRHLNTFAYYSLDIALAVILVLFILFFVLHFVFKLVFRSYFFIFSSVLSIPRTSVSFEVMPRFSGKTVIITGSSNGIGRSAALLFAQDGANVTITGRNAERLEETRQLILKSGVSESHLNSVVADVTTSDGQDKLVKSTLDKFGKIHILVNNAGAAIPDPNGIFGTDQGVNIYHKTMQLNLQAVIEMTQKVKPYLMDTKGEIVNVSSIVAGPQASPKSIYYATAKAALEQYTRSTAIDLIQHGIRVNLVRPGIVETGFMTAMGMPDQGAKKCYNFLAEHKECIPVGVAGKPEDIANIILFLADRNLSSYIIGQSILADGGSTLVMGMHAHNMMDILRS